MSMNPEHHTLGDIKAKARDYPNIVFRQVMKKGLTGPKYRFKDGEIETYSFTHNRWIAINQIRQDSIALDERYFTIESL